MADRIWECDKCGIIIRSSLRPNNTAEGPCEHASGGAKEHRWEELEDDE